MAGSSNIIVRGYNSIYGNNQALIVIDGTPVNNERTTVQTKELEEVVMTTEMLLRTLIQMILNH
jgi:hypothetical protein